MKVGKELQPFRVVNEVELENIMKDFEIADEITEVILLGKSGSIRRIILND